MKIEKLNINGKKESIEVLDKIFSAKINKRLINNILYKTNENYKGLHAKTKPEFLPTPNMLMLKMSMGNLRWLSPFKKCKDVRRWDRTAPLTGAWGVQLPLDSPLIDIVS